MRGHLGKGLATSTIVACFAAMLWTGQAIAADDFTGVQTCEEGHACQYEGSVPVGVGAYYADTALELACTVPLKVPLGNSGNEVAACEKYGFPLYGTQIDIARIRVNGREVALESRPSYFSMGGVHAYGVRVDQRSTRLTTECRVGPESGEPSYCVP